MSESEIELEAWNVVWSGGLSYVGLVCSRDGHHTDSGWAGNEMNAGVELNLLLDGP